MSDYKQFQNHDSFIRFNYLSCIGGSDPLDVDRVFHYPMFLLSIIEQ